MLSSAKSASIYFSTKFFSYDLNFYVKSKRKQTKETSFLQNNLSVWNVVIVIISLQVHLLKYFFASRICFVAYYISIFLLLIIIFFYVDYTVSLRTQCLRKLSFFAKTKSSLLVFLPSLFSVLPSYIICIQKVAPALLV